MFIYRDSTQLTKIHRTEKALSGLGKDFNVYTDMHHERVYGQLKFATIWYVRQYTESFPILPRIIKKQLNSGGLELSGVIDVSTQAVPSCNIITVSGLMG